MTEEKTGSEIQDKYGKTGKIKKQEVLLWKKCV